MLSTHADPVIALLLDVVERALPDPESRARAKARLLEMQAALATQSLTTSIAPLSAETQSSDRWTIRARPTFLYVMYAMILWALPMGLIAAVSPSLAHAIATGMTGYLAALPEPLYTLFGTGYLGYATLRQWGKVKGTDR